ncbi:MAG: hypothetical protein OXC26_01565 [Albidovulum sp.]|nr:hypothetical protein [Albidovulum sp.]
MGSANFMIKPPPATEKLRDTVVNPAASKHSHAVRARRAAADILAVFDD